VGPLVALLIVFGVYPQPLLNIINPAVRQTLSQVHVTDPVPPHPSTTTDSLLIPRRGEAAHVRVLGLPAAHIRDPGVPAANVRILGLPAAHQKGTAP
jgi:hypothetical protein